MHRVATTCNQGGRQGVYGWLLLLLPSFQQQIKKRVTNGVYEGGMPPDNFIYFPSTIPGGTFQVPSVYKMTRQYS